MHRCPQHGRTHRSGEGRAPSLAETAIQAEPNHRPPPSVGSKKAPCLGIKQNPSPNPTLRWRISQRFLKPGFPRSPTNSSPFYPLPLTLATHKHNQNSSNAWCSVVQRPAPLLSHRRRTQTGALPSTPCIRNPKLPRNRASRRYSHYSSFQIHTLEHNASLCVLKEVPSLGELGTKEMKEKALMQRFGLSSQAAFRAGHPNSKRSTWRKEQDWVRPALMLTTPCLHAQLQASVTACHAAAFDRWERHKTIH